MCDDDRSSFIGDFVSNSEQIDSPQKMLGDMFPLAKQQKLALAAYESALKSTPGRLRAEYGAAVSAQEAGIRRAAERHYRILLTNCSHADPDLRDVTQANHFFGRD
jgi:hypothetical protein